MSQRGVVSIQKPDVGEYLLRFNRDVQGCVAVATLGSTGTDAGEITVGVPGFPVTNELRVETFMSNSPLIGGPPHENRDFSVAVFC
jgi:hypothetical protein